MVLRPVRQDVAQISSFNQRPSFNAKAAGRPSLKETSPALANALFGATFAWPLPLFGHGTQDKTTALYLSSLKAQEDLAPLVSRLKASAADALKTSQDLSPQLSKSSDAGAPASRAFDAITPLQESRQLPGLFYKREDLTVTRAYKVRGAVVAMKRAMAAGKKRFVAVSTGNHALAVLKAAELLKPEAVTVFVPENVVPSKYEKLAHKALQLNQQGIHASVVKQGATFDDTRGQVVADAADRPGDCYIDPFGNVHVVAGQGSIGLELVEQLREKLKNPALKELVVISPVGGGGLLSGIASAVTGALQDDPEFRHLQTRFIGVGLQSLDSELGDAIRVAAPCEANQKRFRQLDVEHHRVLTDNNMARCQTFLSRDLESRVEGAAAGSVLPLLTNRFNLAPSPERLIVSIISGGNVG